MKVKEWRLWNRAIIKKGDIVLAFILRGLFLVSFVISLVRQNYDITVVAAGSFALTFIPSVMERSIKVSLPVSFQVVLLIFIFGAQFLGEIFDYYERFWWWDILLHGWSGVLLGTVGFILVYILNTASGVRVVMSPFFVAFFALCFAVTCGVVWEVFEFSMDIVFGTNMQKSGLVDTMGDLMIDTAGALIVSVNGFFALRDKKTNVLSNTISGFMDKNPGMEKRIDEQLKEAKHRHNGEKE